MAGTRSTENVEGETADVQMLREMLEIPSLSGQEQQVAAYLVHAMGGRGLRARVDEAGNAVGEVGVPDAHGRCVDIVLLGHMDTVPGVIPVRLDGDVLHGRGAVDAKGPLAAFVAAAGAARLPAGVRVIVIGATEEESATSKGARYVAGQYRPAACIIGEPSHWDGVTLGYKGRLLVEYRCERASGHTARPVASAADELCRWWERVRCEAETMQSSDRVFDRVQATLRRIEARGDGIRESVEASAGFRLPPGVPPGEVEDLCRRHAPGDAALAFSGREVAHVADRGNAVVRALAGSIRAEGAMPHIKVKTGTSDMNVVGPVWGCPIAAYGAGDSSLDHTPEERVSIAEFTQSIVVLRGTIERLAAEFTGTGAQWAGAGV